MQHLIQEYIDKLKKVDEQLERLMSDRKIIASELSTLSVELRHQSELFGKIVSITLDSTFIFDPNGTFTYASISGAKLLGLKPFDVIGKGWRDLGLPRDIMIPFEAHLKTVSVLGTPLSNTMRVNYPTGIRYLEYFLNPIFNENQNHVVAIVCVIRDATQQRVADTIQQQLTLQYLNEAQQLQQLIDTAPMAIITVDSEGYITAINQAAFELLPHLKNVQKIGLRDKSLADLSSDESAIALALKGEQINALLCQNGERYFLISASPTRDKETSTIIGAVAFFQDVTEQERFRREISRMDRLNLIGEMAAGVAHEIRNPMTVVRGYLQMLSKTSDPQAQEKFAIIMEEVDRIGAIVTDFLSVARNKVVQKSYQNLNDIINSVYPLLQTNALENDVELDLKLDESIPNLSLNEKEIKQLILNLTRNSIEAINAKGKVTIETRLLDETVELSTTDTGCGISRELLDKIFDPFYTTKDNGTGLGLAVCMSIVERHGGTIKVSSEEGAGTTFLISFPIHIDRP